MVLILFDDCVVLFSFDYRSLKIALKVPFLINFISGIMTLEEGDMIMTGTPEGVGAVRPGEVWY